MKNPLRLVLICASCAICATMFMGVYLLMRWDERRQAIAPVAADAGQMDARAVKSIIIFGSIGNTSIKQAETIDAIVTELNVYPRIGMQNSSLPKLERTAYQEIAFKDKDGIPLLTIGVAGVGERGCLSFWLPGRSPVFVKEDVAKLPMLARLKAYGDLCNEYQFLSRYASKEASWDADTLRSAISCTESWNILRPDLAMPVPKTQADLRLHLPHAVPPATLNELLKFQNDRFGRPLPAIK